MRVLATFGVQDTTIAAVDSLSGDVAVALQVEPTLAPRERTGPPDTAWAMKTGYIVASVIFLAYIVLLMRRVASVRNSS